MGWTKLNVFQRLVRRWDAMHPYNAAQVMHLAGDADVASATVAWRRTLAELGLGRVRTMPDRYRFECLNGDAERCIVPRVTSGDTTLAELLTRELNRPFGEDDDHPLRPFVLESHDRTSHYLGVVYHHWIADSVSIRMLLREWFYRIHAPQRARASPLRIASGGYWHFFGPGNGSWRLGEGLLASLRWSSRMKRVRRVECAHFDNYRVHVSLHAMPAGLLDLLHRAARSRRATLNDVYLAALAEVCDRFRTVCPTPWRQDLALGTIVDLRARARADEDMADVFGLFLGFTSVICRPRDLEDFDHLLRRIATQNRMHKLNGVPEASMIRMLAGLVAHRMLGPRKIRQFYRKRLPLAGGVSNVNLNGSWVQQHHPSPILDYIRVSPCGPMMPLVLTPTTLGDRISFGLTCRESVIERDRAMQVSEAFEHRLTDFARGRRA